MLGTTSARAANSGFERKHLVLRLHVIIDITPAGLERFGRGPGIFGIAQPESNEMASGKKKPHISIKPTHILHTLFF